MQQNQQQPEGIWLSPTLIKTKQTPAEKLLLAYICQRAVTADGVCSDSNKELGEALGIHLQTISDLIKKLQQADLLQTMTDSSQANKRTLTPAVNFLSDYQRITYSTPLDYKRIADSTHSASPDYQPIADSAHSVNPDYERIAYPPERIAQPSEPNTDSSLPGHSSTTEPDPVPAPAPAKPLQGLASVSMSEVETLLTTLKQIYDERLADQSIFPLTLVLKADYQTQLATLLAYAKHPDLVNYMIHGFTVYCDEVTQIGSGQPSAGQVLQPSTYYGKTVYRYGPESGILRTDGYTDLLAYFLSQSHRFGTLHAFGQRAMASRGSVTIG